MRTVCSFFLAAALCAWAIRSSAQQVPSTTPAGPGEADSIPEHRRANSDGPIPSASSFEGTIVRSGSQFILRVRHAHTSYNLDDQKKAKEYQGKRVKVTATIDATSSTLNVIDIVAAAESR